MSSDPVLVLVAHGTERASARGVVGALVADVRALLPGVDVRLAHVDVQAPSLATVMADVRAAGRRAVLVPLLLAAGYHVEVDIAEAARVPPDVVTSTLAGHPALVEIALSRLDVDAVDSLVVAAAGSSREAARSQVQAFAAAVAERSGRPTTVGWAATGSPNVGEAVAAAPGRVGVVTYLLAPGVFAARARDAALAAGAPAVGGALGPDPRLAPVVVERFRTAVGSDLRG
ncbi:sirohydrochlorin chelatase [Jatrophihabitans sp. YIM 134969]